MQIPKQVLVTDVVARDGFQNEDRFVSTEDLVHSEYIPHREVARSRSWSFSIQVAGR